MAAVFPPRVTSNIPPVYGSTDDTGYSVSSGVTTDTAASVTFTTLTTNTKWLVQISAQVSLPGNTTARAEVYAKVDGASTDTDGVYGVDYVSNVGKWVNRTTITGRVVVTLASAASHTILAQAFASGEAITYDTVTITVSQLAG